MTTIPSPLKKKEGPKAHYWKLKNKDVIMKKFGQERAQVIIKEFTKILDEYCGGSFENDHAIDQPLYYKSNKRIDFMMNVHQEIIKYSTSELGKLKNERNRRL